MNKKISISLIAILTACSQTIMPHECKKMDDGQYFCLTTGTLQYIQDQSEHYRIKNDIQDIYNYAKTEDDYGYNSCHFDKNYKSEYMSQLGECLGVSFILWPMLPFCPIVALDGADQGIYVDETKEPIDKETNILVCDHSFSSDYEGRLQTLYEQQEEQRSKKEAEEKNKEVEAAIKKYGYNLCVMPSIHEMMAYNMTFWKDCMISTRGRATRVFQQTDAGTLIKHPSNMVDTIVLVEKHPKLSQLVDDQYFNGYFVGTGTYQYVTVTGATKTIQKVRYLGE